MINNLLENDSKNYFFVESKEIQSITKVLEKWTNITVFVCDILEKIAETELGRKENLNLNFPSNLTRLKPLESFKLPKLSSSYSRYEMIHPYTSILLIIAENLDLSTFEPLFDTSFSEFKMIIIGDFDLNKVPYKIIYHENIEFIKLSSINIVMEMLAIANYFFYPTTAKSLFYKEDTGFEYNTFSGLLECLFEIKKIPSSKSNDQIDKHFSKDKYEAFISKLLQ
ncbi:MAG: hypothetical protein ACN6PN_01780 [Sphingobacterium sp.]